MNRAARTRSVAIGALSVFAIVFATLAPTAASAASTLHRGAVSQTIYAVDFVATAARGVAMNDRGDVAGTSYPDTGCGSSCLPPLETVVWKHGVRIVLPGLPGRPAIQAYGMNSGSWVVGSAAPSVPGFDDHAVVWKPVGGGYQAIDLGVLPGTTRSVGIGIDDSNRAVGYSTTTGFPPTTKSFLWTEADGLVDLTAAGFPDTPVAISPGGTVATSDHWYILGDLGSVKALASPPAGFGLQPTPAAINDEGDQARFLVSSSAENLVYPFRYHHAGTWQQISFAGTGHLATAGVGSITDAGDITATVRGVGVMAPGPDGLAQPLGPMVSPAYGTVDVSLGGPINTKGEILTQVIVGRSQRLVRLVPVSGCASGCVRVTGLEMRGTFIEDPNDPGQCTPNASDHVVAKLTVRDEAGHALRGVKVTGHFLDDYWLDQAVTGRTTPRGRIRFVHDGPACVGAVAFLVTRARMPARTFDRTTGKLADWVIPA
jgi:hypothetical protein